MLDTLARFIEELIDVLNFGNTIIVALYSAGLGRLFWGHVPS